MSLMVSLWKPCCHSTKASLVFMQRFIQCLYDMFITNVVCDYNLCLKHFMNIRMICFGCNKHAI